MVAEFGNQAISTECKGGIIDEAFWLGTEIANQGSVAALFQANPTRLFEWVIQPAMEPLPVHSSLQGGEAATMDQFLDRAAAQVDNYTANEAAKAFTLTLAAIFERQLSIWARAVHLDDATDMPKSRGSQGFLSLCAERAGIDVGQGELGVDLTEMFMVANVVRHGEGSSCEKLKTIAPALWDDAANDYYDLLIVGCGGVGADFRILVLRDPFARLVGRRLTVSVVTNAPDTLPRSKCLGVSSAGRLGQEDVSRGFCGAHKGG